ELLLGDTDPLIGDGDAYAAVILGTNIDRVRVAARRVFDRVRQEVVQHLFQVVAIRGHDAGGVASDRDRVRRGGELHPRGHLVRELPYVDVAVAEFDAAGLDAGHVEQLVDEPRELRGLAIHDLELFGDPAQPLGDRRGARALAKPAHSTQRDL